MKECLVFIQKNLYPHVWGYKLFLSWPFWISNQFYHDTTLEFPKDFNFFLDKTLWNHTFFSQFLGILSEFSSLLISSTPGLEVQLVWLNHCDGVYSHYWHVLIKAISQYQQSLCLDLTLKAIQILKLNIKHNSQCKTEIPQTILMDENQS